MCLMLKRETRVTFTKADRVDQVVRAGVIEWGRGLICIFSVNIVKWNHTVKCYQNIQYPGGKIAQICQNISVYCVLAHDGRFSFFVILFQYR